MIFQTKLLCATVHNILRDTSHTCFIGILLIYFFEIANNPTK